MRYYATNRKVEDLRPSEVIAFFFYLPNPSSRIMTLGSIQPLTEFFYLQFESAIRIYIL
jgi:hypothetical protein